MADSSPKDPLSTTMREEGPSASGEETTEDDDDLRDTQLTPIVGEAQASALARDSAPPASKATGAAGAARAASSSSSGAAGSISKDAPSSRVSLPPSEPRGSRTSFSQIELSTDRPARLQMIVALVLGLVLVAIPLYLWRRPRADSITVASSSSAAAATVEPTSPVPPPDPKPALSEAKVLLCQDPGPKKTSPEQCDHVAELEKSLAKAIEESASCVPKDAGGGALQYVMDVSFKKRSFTVTTPKDGRTLKNAKVGAACASAVRSKLTVSFDTLKHDHARYKIAITATYK